jgi:hypothetical protein
MCCEANGPIKRGKTMACEHGSIEIMTDKTYVMNTTACRVNGAVRSGAGALRTIVAARDQSRTGPGSGRRRRGAEAAAGLFAIDVCAWQDVV